MSCGRLAVATADWKNHVIAAEVVFKVIIHVVSSTTLAFCESIKMNQCEWFYASTSLDLPEAEHFLLVRSNHSYIADLANVNTVCHK